MKRKRLITYALFLTALMIVASLSVLTVGMRGSDGASPQRASIMSSWSPTTTVFGTSGVQMLDGDMYKGNNYFYAIADQYLKPANVQFKRSVDGVSWSSATILFSGLDHPHAGFCAYKTGGSDVIIASSLGQVKRSTDNGATFSSLTSLSASLDYTGVTTNTTMDPSRAYDNNIYVAGNYKWSYNGIYLTKSVNNGVSWSPMYLITNTLNSFCPVFIRDSSKMFCFYGVNYGDIYLKTSMDWGVTWSAAIKVITTTQGEVKPCHAQYIDEQRCLLTYEDIGGVPYSNSRGVYGYFWFSNNTFQQIGYETGAAYNNGQDRSYAGIAFQDSQGVNYTSLWCYYVDSGTSQMRVHYTHDSGVSVSSISVKKELGNEYINGGVSLGIQAALEGWPGDGTSDSPYVIDGYVVNSSTNNGIHIANTNDYFVISNVTVESDNNAYKGVYLNNADNGRLENITSSGNRYGIYAVGCDNLELDHCAVENNSGNGIYVGACTNMKIEDCDFENNGNHGLHTAACKNVTISNIVVRGNAWHGIYVRLCNNLTIINCTADNNGLYGIYLSGCTNVVVDGTGSNGYACGNTRSGIMLAECSNVMIKNMVIDNNNWYGVHKVNSTNITLTGCDLTGNKSGPKNW